MLNTDLLINLTKKIGQNTVTTTTLKQEKNSLKVLKVNLFLFWSTVTRKSSLVQRKKERIYCKIMQ